MDANARTMLVRDKRLVFEFLHPRSIWDKQSV